jgi:CMP-N-acetylneuraminic acid synthetase
MLVAVIPARGGSKGVPRKNILPVCGKPLIAWSIESAKNSELVDEVVVSTEDPEIKAVSEKWGARVIDRPLELASDEATTVSVLQHVVGITNPDEVVVLQPTSPLRAPDLIDRCIKRYRESNCDNVATGYHCKMRAFGSYDNLRRQDLEGFFYDDGNVYVLDPEVIKAGRWSGDRIEHVLTRREETYEIDDEIDFFIVEKLLEREVAAVIVRQRQTASDGI